MIIHCDTTRFILEVLERGEYSFMFDDLTVVDLGCNVGAFSMWIYPRASVIHAVDLSVANIEHLNKTIKDNGLGKIKTYCCAIAGETGTRKSMDPSAPGDGSWQLSESGNVAVDAYSLSDFLLRNGINKVDVLKMDVEGAEKEILEVPNFPTNKIDTIVGEFHIGTEDIDRLLRNVGYSCTIYPGGHFAARRLP